MSLLIDRRLLRTTEQTYRVESRAVAMLFVPSETPAPAGGNY
ncbi:hypothetical protein [Candidatus Laterigemmans baculatus]|nr:hypothetical protein [Candidatus Laterigemmans baculatus]